MTSAFEIKLRIRKLLRLAKTPGPEGEVAATRAQELMNKHGIEISADDVRVKVLDSADSWRQHLLLAIARQHGCKCLQATKGDVGSSYLAGDAVEVERARELFTRVQDDLVALSSSRYHIVARVLWPHMIPYKMAADLWDAAFFETAANAIIQSIAVPEPQPEPGIAVSFDDPPPDAPPRQRPAQRIGKIEPKKLEAPNKLRDLIEQVGSGAISSMLAFARHNGEIGARMLISQMESKKKLLKTA